LHSIMANFKPKELWLGSNPPTADYVLLLRQAAEQGVGAVKMEAGDSFDFGGAHFDVFAPAVGWRPVLSARNDDSLVMRMTVGRTSALFTGDIEKRIERGLAGTMPHSDLLKVAHHGSATSTTPELLAAVHPQYALISVGYHSIFGHPKFQVLSRLSAAHVRTYRTDMDGLTTFYLDGKTVQPVTTH
jgi:competence protein ComEC